MNLKNLPAAVIPMVIETTGTSERAFDVFSMLLHNRIILVGDQINDRTANLVVAQLLYLSHLDPVEPIQMYIQCPGGVIYSGLAIYDAMQTVPNPIATVAVGFTASFGTILLTAGAKGQRYALPNATIHMHQPLGGARGQASEIEIQAREIMRLKSAVNRVMAKHTGQTEETIERDTERDFFMTADQAVTYGLIDHVMEPGGAVKPDDGKE
jgi:ATP-dependent Clp protease protease subunit